MCVREKLNSIRIHIQVTSFIWPVNLETILLNHLMLPVVAVTAKLDRKTSGWLVREERSCNSTSIVNLDAAVTRAQVTHLRSIFTSHCIVLLCPSIYFDVGIFFSETLTMVIRLRGTRTKKSFFIFHWCTFWVIRLAGLIYKVNVYLFFYFFLSLFLSFYSSGSKGETGNICRFSMWPKEHSIERKRLNHITTRRVSSDQWCF